MLDNLHLAWIIKDERALFPSVKPTYLPIMKNILEMITSQPTRSLKDLNIDIVFIIACSRFLHLGKLTYIISKLKKKSTFVRTHTTRSDVSFAEEDQFVGHRLKYSITDVDHSGV